MNDRANLSPEIAEAEAVDSEMMMQISPNGRFTSKSLNPLVKATNMLLPAFSQEPTYPDFDPGTYDQWPEDLVRIYSMFAAASRDAAVDETISDDLVIDFENVTDDNDLQVLAGKVQALARHKDFKKWLKMPRAEAPTAEVDEEEEADMSDDQIDILFRSRL